MEDEEEASGLIADGDAWRAPGIIEREDDDGALEKASWKNIPMSSDGEHGRTEEIDRRIVQSTGS